MSAANAAALLSLVASVFFILALKGLSHPLSARRGNRFGIVGMSMAVVMTLALAGQWQWVLVALAVLSALPVPVTAAPPALPPAQANVLLNADLESFQGNGMATNWESWWNTIANTGNGNLKYSVLPDFVPENNPVFVRSGGGSQHIGRNWDPWHAGIRQTRDAIS